MAGTADGAPLIVAASTAVGVLVSRRCAVLALMLLLAGLVPGVVAGSVEAVTCFGRPATVVGTDGPDVLTGTEGADVIVGLGGDDTIYGLGGGDRICGGPGNDVIDGGRGNDRVSGGDGDDVIEGGGGRDLLKGEGGNDQIDGGFGDDTLAGGPGDDAVTGGPGRDSLDGGVGRDSVSGGGGGDACLGEETKQCEGRIINRWSRAAVAAAFNEIREPALLVPMDWTGSIEACNPGATSARHEAATLAMLNYYRSMAGVLPVVFVDEFSRKAQAAALIMAAQQDVNHYPPETWPCWTEEGAEGAAHSSLYWWPYSWDPFDNPEEAGGPDGMRGYMVEIGLNANCGNSEAGHRRAMLNPAALDMGTGTTAQSNALWVLGDFDLRRMSQIVVWPPAGYVPYEEAVWLFSFDSRWTLDITHARIRVTVEGTRVQTIDGLFGSSRPFLRGDGILVWEVPDLRWFSGVSPFDLGEGMEDLPVKVTISGLLKDGVETSYEYEFIIFDPAT